MTAFTVLRPALTPRDGAVCELAGAVVAIGNFDGVHRGHREVIAQAQTRARALGRPAAALTFEPHPRSFFRPQTPVFRLSDARNKLRLLAGTGLDGAIVLEFDARLAGLSATDFFESVLARDLAVGGITIGFDFHFGRDRQGSPAFLQAKAAERGLAVDVVAPMEDEGRPVSSSTIRADLAAGRVVEAAELLGAPWFVSGAVIHGEKRGRALGIPTANFALDPACGLKHGIYAVRARHGETLIEGVASFGRRPTFDNGAPLLEVHLFDFSGDLYGDMLDIAFIAWIRPELRFDSIDALRARMAEDCLQARAALARNARSFPPLRALGV